MSNFSAHAVPSSIALPEAPASLAGPVKAWSEPIPLTTELPGSPDRNPLFVTDKNRAYGYPLSLVEVAAQAPVEHRWQALHLENEFLRLLILPEAGGRLHLALNKSNGTEILARQDIVRANLTTGNLPGGFEVNWPVDPRPRALTPAVTRIEEHGDGARTVWCSLFDPQTRLKAMHGYCLYPGRSYLELKVRLYNRTALTEVFNWSVTAAVPAPGTDALLAFPPSLSASRSFLGFYSPVSKAGFLQIAPESLSAGHALTVLADTGEIRAGVYSGLPPRVTTLLPTETKSFSQFWYPFSSIGPVQAANVDAAVRFTTGEALTVGVAVTRIFGGASVVLETEGSVLHRWNRDLAPGSPLLEDWALPAEIDPVAITVKVLTSAGRELLAYTPHPAGNPVEAPVADPGTPKKLLTAEALHQAALTVQYDRSLPAKAEDYWQEALKRDVNHPASNNAIGLLQWRRGEFGEAETRFRKAIEAYGSSQSDATTAEFHYHLGLALRYQDRDEEAQAAFLRASWHFAWRAASLHAVAELDCKRGNFGIVPKNLYESLRLNADNNNARSLAVVLFRRFGRAAEAEHLIRESLTLDPLDPWACHLAGQPFPGDNQVRLDLAFDYARAGLFDLAIELLTGADTFAQDGSLPMVHYTLASCYMRVGDFRAAQREYEAAAATTADLCFPHRLDEMMVLARAITLQPEDARAQYYLGNLLFSYGLPLQAIEIWESSAKLDAQFTTVWRNLALAHATVTGNHEKALDAFDTAFGTDPTDTRLFFERDRLWRQLGVPPTLRFTEFQQHAPLAAQRLDTALELASLYNSHNQPDDALALFSSEHLKGWERDSAALDEYIRTFVKLSRKALLVGDFERARDLLLLPLSMPEVNAPAENGVPKAAELRFWLGEVLRSAGHEAAAQAYWQNNASLDKSLAKTAPPSPYNFFVALSYSRIGDRTHSRRMLRELWFTGRRIARETSDAPKEQRVRGLLLQAQARVGLGQLKLAGRLLEQLLTLHPNSGRALDLISDLEESKRAAG